MIQQKTVYVCSPREEGKMRSIFMLWPSGITRVVKKAGGGLIIILSSQRMPKIIGKESPYIPSFTWSAWAIKTFSLAIMSSASWLMIPCASLCSLSVSQLNVRLLLMVLDRSHLLDFFGHRKRSQRGESCGHVRECGFTFTMPSKLFKKNLRRLAPVSVIISSYST